MNAMQIFVFLFKICEVHFSQEQQLSYSYWDLFVFVRFMFPYSVHSTVYSLHWTMDTVYDIGIHV